MAQEPINIFSRKIDPVGVLRLLRTMSSTVIVTGPEDDWSQADVIITKKGLFRRERKLSIGHNSEYYDGEDWPVQRFGMLNYFSSFPETPHNADILRLINSFRFSLSVPTADLDIEGHDDRLELLFAVCRFLDGAFFTPSSLRDSSGRILISATNPSDPAAVMPLIPTVSEQSADEEEVRTPPSTERVVRRTLALTAVAARATLELDALKNDVETPELHRKRILDWVENIGIRDELEPQEWKVLQRPAKKLEQRDFINAMWRVEGLAVLAWALHLHPLPPYDELIVPTELYRSIGLFDVEAAKALQTTAKLRSPTELQTMHDHLLAFHWRMRNFSLRPDAMDFAEFSKNCWFGSFDVSQFKLADGDLAIGESAIADADPEAVGIVNSIAVERHLAINWLMGDSVVYSDTDTST